MPEQTPERCPKVDAHLHSDSIQYGNIEDNRTVFWLEHHPSLVEFEAAALKRKWEAAPELLDALTESLAVIQLWRKEGKPDLYAFLAVVDKAENAIRKANGE